MNLLLLTYDHPHRKTQDVAWRLLSAGHKFQVLATPWIDRRPRRMLFAHRPAELTWPCDPIGDHIDFFRNLGVSYMVVPPDSLSDTIAGAAPDVVVIGGAGILDKSVVDQFKVLNVHPGLLPASRGLDILKWDVVECNKVGVTAHLCDDETDLGWRVLEETVPVFRFDSFHSFAMRQYEWELALIARAIPLLARSRQDFPKIERSEQVARRRMGTKIESQLPAAFERFKMVYAQ